MLKKLALATAAVGLLMSTASADYYIVQEKATKKCKVVETRPTETTWIQIGPAAFNTESDGDTQSKRGVVKKYPLPFWGGPGGGPGVFSAQPRPPRRLIHPRNK